MADLSIALEQLLRKTGADDDFIREAVRVLVEGLMEIEVSQPVGARLHERSAERKAYQERQWDTRVGTIDLQIPACNRLLTCPVSSNPADGRRKRLWP